MHTQFLLETWKKRLVGRPKHEWENIKIDLKEAECAAMDYTLNSGHSEVAVSCEYSNKPSGFLHQLNNYRTFHRKLCSM